MFKTFPCVCSCKPGYYDLASGDGCEACECDLLGSSDLQCSEDGSCMCNAGYFGMKCNECSSDHYYDPIVGCAREYFNCFIFIIKFIVDPKVVQVFNYSYIFLELD